MKAVYSRDEYFKTLIAEVAALGRGDRVTLATMSFAPDDVQVGAILRALGAAARRGVAVKLIVDAYVFLLHNGRRPGPYVFGTRLPARLSRPFRRIYEALEELRADGGQYAVINQPGRALSLPLAGRSHIKFGIINDQVFIGGCNLDGGSTADIMAGWQDAHTAQWLQELAGSMMRSGSAMAALDEQDIGHTLSDSSALFVDAGVAGRSLIFEQAMALIDAAQEHVFIACQFFPNDVTARHLLAAHKRGVKVEILYNHPSQHTLPHNALHHYVVGAERMRLPKSFFVQALRPHRPFLHAKLIATEQGAMMGSHNFVTAGVKLGTAEIALLERDPDFARRAVAAIRGQLTG
jgi:cardiolipin synthase